MDGKEYSLFEGEVRKNRNGDLAKRGKLRIFDTSTWKIKRSVDYKDSSGVFSSDGRFFICPNSVLDIKTGKSHPLKLQKVPQDDKSGGIDARYGIFDNMFGKGIDVMPSGKTVIALKSSGYGNRGLVFYDIASGKMVKELDKLPIQGFRVFPDGKRMLATYFEDGRNYEDGSGRLVVIDLEQGEVLFSIVTKGNNKTPYAVSPDGKYFAAYVMYEGLKIFDATTYQPISTIAMNFSYIDHIVFLQDCKTLAYVTTEMDMSGNQASDEYRRKYRIRLFRAE